MVSFKKYLVAKYGDDNEPDNNADMNRGKILLWRLTNPKKVNLTDGRTFYTRYEKVSQKNYLQTWQEKKRGQLDQDLYVSENNKELEYLAVYLNSVQNILNEAT